MKKFTSMKSHVCDLCGDTFIHKLSLVTHQRVHTNNCTNIYSCKICNSSFSEKGTLQEHQKTHHNKKSSYFCETCGRACYRKHHLESHDCRAQPQIDAKQKSHVCDVCGYISVSEEWLNRHERIHHIRKQCVCVFVVKVLHPAAVSQNIAEFTLQRSHLLVSYVVYLSLSALASKYTIICTHWEDDIIVIYVVKVLHSLEILKGIEEFTPMKSHLFATSVVLLLFLKLKGLYGST